MRFSKLRTTMERFFCERLKGRIHLHAAVYHTTRDGEARVWVTLDGEEILSVSSAKHAVEHERLYQALKKEKNLQQPAFDPARWEAFYNSPEREALDEASDQASGQLQEKGIFPLWYWSEAIQTYSSLPFDECLRADNVIVQAFAMLDRRLGKRRLARLAPGPEAHLLVREFYHIRCEAEGMQKNPASR